MFSNLTLRAAGVRYLLVVLLFMGVVSEHGFGSVSPDARRLPRPVASGDSLVFIPSGEEGMGVALIRGTDTICRQTHPVGIVLRGETEHTLTGNEEELIWSPYTGISVSGDKICAVAEVTTRRGSVFGVTDIYDVSGEDAVVVHREVSVVSDAGGESGFASIYALQPGKTDGSDAYEYFMPSILYRDTECMRRGSVASDLSYPRVMVKETRCGLPMAMLRDSVRHSAFSLTHIHPAISVGGLAGGGAPAEVCDSLLFGSIGYIMEPEKAVAFRYPSAEGPATYEPLPEHKRGRPVWSDRYHSVRTGTAHSYSLAVIPDRSDNYNDAMVNSFTVAYHLENPAVAPMDMGAVYQQNIDMFKNEYNVFGTGRIRAAGVPWSLNLPDASGRVYTFQMGFVGQQLPVGFHLYRYGLDNNDPEAADMGRSIVDFWVSEAIMDDYFPIVWWDPVDDDTAGHTRGYPTFLRCLTDGMEGLLDAWRISVAYGRPERRWFDALCRVGEHLAARQNPDGSFFRAYSTDGEIAPEYDRNTHADSRLNTPVAVRFLAKMYDATGDERYRQAAVKAAEYSYRELFQKMGKYVGGTPDNPNTVDKEAAVYAMYAFDSAHDLTGDPKFLRAAEHAAMCMMSWAYCYDYRLPNRDGADASQNPFANGGISGFSLISTGHSGADNYLSFTFFGMFRLYVKTGNEQYLHMARFLQNNTKLNSDYDGRLGYRYRAFMPEATNVADFAFRSVGAWLPWSSIANIEPIVNLEEAFGCNDLMQLTDPLPVLQEKLHHYGSGGRPMRGRVATAEAVR